MEVRLQKAATDSRISSADFVQTKGFGSSFDTSRNSRIAFSRSETTGDWVTGTHARARHVMGFTMRRPRQSGVRPSGFSPRRSVRLGPAAQAPSVVPSKVSHLELIGPLESKPKPDSAGRAGISLCARGDAQSSNLFLPSETFRELSEASLNLELQLADLQRHRPRGLSGGAEPEGLLMRGRGALA